MLIREVDPSSEGTRRAKRVAVIADVHGNAPALRAVLGELAGSEADLFVSLGDATWGIQPEETRELLQAVELPASEPRERLARWPPDENVRRSGDGGPTGTRTRRALRTARTGRRA